VVKRSYKSYIHPFRAVSTNIHILVEETPDLGRIAIAAAMRGVSPPTIMMLLSASFANKPTEFSQQWELGMHNLGLYWASILVKTEHQIL
jgi:hypothetical protein